MRAHGRHLKITIAEGRAVFTRVELDGVPLAATRVSFDTGDDLDGFVKVRVEFYADVEVEGRAAVVLSPRYVKVPDWPLRLRLRFYYGRLLGLMDRLRP